MYLYSTKRKYFFRLDKIESQEQHYVLLTEGELELSLLGRGARGDKDAGEKHGWIFLKV